MKVVKYKILQPFHTYIFFTYRNKCNDCIKQYIGIAPLPYVCFLRQTEGIHEPNITLINPFHNSF